MSVRPRSSDTHASVNRESRIELEDLVILPGEDGDQVIGAPATKAFMQVEPAGIQFLAALREGGTVGDAEARYKEKTGEEVNGVDFAIHLTLRGFVKSVNGVEIKSDLMQRRRRVFAAGVQPGKVKWLRSPALYCVTLSFWLAAIALAIDQQLDLPSPGDIRISEHASIIMVVTFLAMLGNAFVHEMAHLFVARSYGIPANVRLSHRWHIVVLETDVTNAWTIPPRQRMHIFLAGLWYNTTFLALALIAAQLIQARDGPADLVAALRFLAFINVFPIQFQFLLWIRTDLYYVLMTATGHNALQQDSRLWIRHQFTKIADRLRGYPRPPCGACGRQCHQDDHVCPSCGKERWTIDPNKTNYRRRSAWMLAFYSAISILFVPLIALMLLAFITGTATLLFDLVAMSIKLTLQGASAWHLADALVSLTVVCLQLGLIAFVALPGFNQLFNKLLGLGVSGYLALHRWWLFGGRDMDST